MQLSVRDVDEKVFREFRAEAVREGMLVGKALSLAMSLWLQKNAKPFSNMLNFKPMKLGKGTEKLGEEIDKILYS